MRIDEKSLVLVVNQLANASPKQKLIWATALIFLE
jgi:hypothetical protein